MSTKTAWTKQFQRFQTETMIIIRVGFLLSALFLSTLAWIPTSTRRKVKPLLLQGASDAESAATRRRFLETTSAASIGIFTSLPYSANALVKGVAPPPKKSLGDKPKCTNVEECQAMAETRDQALREKEEKGPPPMVTSTGVKYRDTEDGSGDREVKDGDEVEVYYKVLKLGKRSYDGLSGEGTVVFSRGMCSGCVLNMNSCHLVMTNIYLFHEQGTVWKMTKTSLVANYSPQRLVVIPTSLH